MGDRLVYEPRKLSGVMTIRSRVARVLHVALTFANSPTFVPNYHSNMYVMQWYPKCMYVLGPIKISRLYSDTLYVCMDVLRPLNYAMECFGQLSFHI
jgi:hypothetical protein